jgi:hypothetical protein
VDREAVEIERWLQMRATNICGTLVARTGELFEPLPVLAAWQSLSLPLDRLSAFAADASNSPATRRAANSAAELYRRRRGDREARATLSSPRLRPVGMLMLVPPGHAA